MSSISRQSPCLGTAPDSYPGHIVQFCGLDGYYSCPCGWALHEDERPYQVDPVHFLLMERFIGLMKTLGLDPNEFILKSES